MTWEKQEGPNPLGRPRWCAPPSGAYSNLKSQVRALEALLQKLPDASSPARPRLATGHRRAKQLQDDKALELVAAYETGASVHQLSRRYGIARQTVSKILRRHGVQMRKTGLSDEQIEEAVRLYQDGWTLAKIGGRMGVSPDTVRLRLRERGVRMRPRGARPR